MKAQAHLRQNLRRLKERCHLELAFGDPVLQLASNVVCSVHDEIDGSDEALLRPPGPALLGDVFTADWPAFDDWLQALRVRLASDRKRRIERRSVELEQRGDLDDALRLALRLVDDDASDEDAHRRSMWLHLRRGDLTSARAAFDACCTALARTSRVRPGAQTLELLAAIDRGTQASLPAFVVAPSLVRPPRLVGRDDACRAIDVAWQAGRPVLLLGDPGVGKSRLLADLAHRREAGMAPVAARQGDAGVAYSLLGRLLGTLARTSGDPPAWVRERLAGIVGAWGQAPSPAATTLQLRQALDAALDGWAGNGLRGLVLDDLQYADESSLEWLVHTAGRSGATPLRLLLAARAEGLPAVLAEAAAARGSSVTLVALAPFDPWQVADLLDDLALPGLDGATWSAALHALSGGVAFDLLSAVIALQSRGVRDFSGGPAALLDGAAPLPDATLGRLRWLPDDANSLARIAAIAGQDFEVDLAADLLRVPSVAIATPWKTLAQAGVFGPAGFVHDRILHAVDESIPDAVAQSLHRQVAQWLARQPGTGTRATAARIAAHWEAAQRWAEAGRAFEDAAEVARLRSSRREEWQALTGAVRCHRRAEGGRSGTAFACECRRVRLMPGLRPLEEALVCADALVGDANDSEERAEALEARSIVRSNRYDSEGALADALEARRLAAKPRLRLLASLQAARSLVRLSRHDEALRLFEVAPEELQALDPAERLLWLSETGTTLDYADRRGDAIAAFDRAIEQGRAGRLWDGVNNALNDKSIALVYANRLEESNAALRDGIDCGRRAGYDDDGLLLDTMTLAANLRNLGRFDEALALGEPLPAKLRQAGYGAWSHNAEHDLAGLFLSLGRPELAARAMDRSVRPRAAWRRRQARTLGSKPTLRDDHEPDFHAFVVATTALRRLADQLPDNDAAGCLRWRQRQRQQRRCTNAHAGFHRPKPGADAPIVLAATEGISFGTTADSLLLMSGSVTRFVKADGTGGAVLPPGRPVYDPLQRNGLARIAATLTCKSPVSASNNCSNGTIEETLLDGTTLTLGQVSHAVDYRSAVFGSPTRLDSSAVSALGLPELITFHDARDALTDLYMWRHGQAGSLVRLTNNVP